MMVTSVVLPAVLFTFASWLSYRHEYAVADDRIERSLGGKELLASDPRLAKLREAIKVLLQNEPERAAKVQMVFSDMTPRPSAAKPR